MVLVIGAYTFPHSPFFKTPNYLLWGISIPVAMFFEITKERVYQINFDEDKKRIAFLYKTSAFSKCKKYELPYEVARIERSEDKWFGQPFTVSFSKNKLEVFEISKWKDGFSKKALHEIYNTCVQIYLTQKTPTYAQTHS